jgi:hypothetical protein
MNETNDNDIINTIDSLPENLQNVVNIMIDAKAFLRDRNNEEEQRNYAEQWMLGEIEYWQNQQRRRNRGIMPNITQTICKIKIHLEIDLNRIPENNRANNLLETLRSYWNHDPCNRYIDERDNEIWLERMRESMREHRRAEREAERAERARERIQQNQPQQEEERAPYNAQGGRKRKSKKQRKSRKQRKSKKHSKK